MNESTAAHLFTGLQRRTGSAVLILMACATTPTSADASQPPAAAPVCDGGHCIAPASVPQTAVLAQAPSTYSTPATKASAESPCDTNWPDGQALIIALGQRPDDGKPLEPFRPSDPMHPYDLPGGRFLFGERGTVYTAVGRFERREEDKAKEALKQVELKWPSSRSVITTLGPYLVPESPTCRPSRMARGKNPFIDKSSWLVEKEGVLLAGTQTDCKNGMLTKKVTVLSCDGMKTLMTDSVEKVCDVNRHVDTCMYSLEPSVVFIKHTYRINGETSIQARALNVRTRKVVFKQDITHGTVIPDGAPESTPEPDFEDVDQDGVPERVETVPDTGERTSVRKWHQGRFVETNLP